MLSPSPSPPPPPPPPVSPPTPRTPPTSPPPSLSVTTPLATPPGKQVIPVSHKQQLAISKPSRSQQSPAVEKQIPDIKRTRIPPVFQHPRPRRTNLLIWCGAAFCLVLSLILILFGITTLITFLAIKPRNPVFDTPRASLSTIYFDSPEYFNGDFTFLANFSNPNRKIRVRFEYLEIELYFSNTLISTQVVQPFTQQPGQRSSVSVHMISSLVYMPQNFGVELRKQVLCNRVNCEIRGSFKVKATLGVFRYSYWLHSRCQLEITGPPTGVLVAHNCRTKR